MNVVNFAAVRRALEREDLRASRTLAATLDRAAKGMVERAIARAKQNKRKTVRGGDV